MVKPSELRDADIKSIRQGGEDHAVVELENGNSHHIDIEELIKDWLFLHKKLQQAKGWVAGVNRG